MICGSSTHRPAPAGGEDPHPAGPIVPLGSVATMSTGKPEAEIDRQNLRTYLGVTARLSGTSLGGAVDAIKSKLDANLHLPSSISIQYGGLYEQQQSSFRQFILVLFASLVLVGIILLFEFGDWRAPVLTAVLALSSLFGVFAALRLTGTTLNVSSFVGLIMMVGIVGENSVFVIHEAKLLLRRDFPVWEAWRSASRLRERPVAMTILATSFALAPLASDSERAAAPAAAGDRGDRRIHPLRPDRAVLPPSPLRLARPEGETGKRPKKPQNATWPLRPGDP